MIKKLFAALLSAAAAVSASSAGAQTVQINFGSSAAIPGSNDFQSDLAVFGLTHFATSGADLILSGPANITFSFLGSESGFSDTFTAPGGVTHTENSLFSSSFNAPLTFGTSWFAAGGSLVNLLNFSSSGGVSATVGQDGFGIFLGPNAWSGMSTNVFYLGYDDQINNADDNHDDFIIQAIVSNVPEPATWGMMLIGFGAVGAAMRRRRLSLQPRRVLN